MQDLQDEHVPLPDRGLCRAQLTAAKDVHSPSAPGLERSADCRWCCCCRTCEMSMCATSRTRTLWWGDNGRPTSPNPCYPRSRLQSCSSWRTATSPAAAASSRQSVTRGVCPCASPDPCTLLASTAIRQQREKEDEGENAHDRERTGGLLGLEHGMKGGTLMRGKGEGECWGWSILRNSPASSPHKRNPQLLCMSASPHLLDQAHVCRGNLLLFCCLCFSPSADLDPSHCDRGNMYL